MIRPAPTAPFPNGADPSTRTTADYRFVTRWHIRAPLETVWEALYRSERWPQWWRGLREVVELCPGRADGVGCVRRFTWQGPLPYTLVVDMQVTRVERPHVLESVASGELQGRGCWSLSEEQGGAAVRYDWQVCTAKRWMNWLAPVARPIFRWNHDMVMRRGEQGLRRLLEAASAAGLRLEREGDAGQEGLLDQTDGEDAQHEAGQRRARERAHRDG